MEKISNNDKSQVLIDALPYIQKYNNKILVIKYGGNAMTNKELKDAVMTDIVLLSLVGVKVVLVHGGGPEISDMLKKLNIESRFVNGLRYTDDATVDVVKMVLAGKLNKELVALLTAHKGTAIGLCGIDGQMPIGSLGERSYRLLAPDSTVIANASGTLAEAAYEAFYGEEG